MWSRWRWVEDVDPVGKLAEGEPEVADPGAGVEHEQRAVGEPQRDARGVPAVADGLGPGLGTEPRAPQTVRSISLLGRAPRRSPGAHVPSVPVIRNAQTSISCSASVAERMRIRSADGSSFESAIESGSSSTGNGDPSGRMGANRVPHSSGAIGPASS